jgi:acetyl esterase/lipase
LLAWVPFAIDAQRPVDSQWPTIAATEDRIYPNVVYNKVGGVEVKLDVITAGPDFQPPPLMFIHGGGWVDGSKDSSTLGALPYLARDMNVVDVEYRLASVALAPAAVEECRCALRWIYQNAKHHGFDTKRLAVAGGSAGGHSALMVGGMLDPKAGLDNAQCGAWPSGHYDLKVAAIVNYYGITDVNDVLEGPLRQDWAVAWFGGLPERDQLAKRLCPLSYLRAGLPPILTIHGDLDATVPYEQGVRLHKALDRAVATNEFLTIEGGQHGFNIREQNLKAQQGVVDFLEKHGVLAH